MRWATDINTDPSCIWITNSDMALGSSLGPENIIVLNGSPSHSDQDDARRHMTLDTSETTGCSPNPRLNVAFDSNIGCGHQHRPLSCDRTMDPNTVLGDDPDHWNQHGLRWQQEPWTSTQGCTTGPWTIGPFSGNPDSNYHTEIILIVTLLG